MKTLSVYAWFPLLLALAGYSSNSFASVQSEMAWLQSQKKVKADCIKSGGKYVVRVIPGITRYPTKSGAKIPPAVEYNDPATAVLRGAGMVTFAGCLPATPSQTTTNKPTTNQTTTDKTATKDTDKADNTADKGKATKRTPASDDDDVEDANDGDGKAEKAADKAREERGKRDSDPTKEAIAAREAKKANERDAERREDLRGKPKELVDRAMKEKDKLDESVGGKEHQARETGRKIATEAADHLASQDRADRLEKRLDNVQGRIERAVDKANADGIVTAREQAHLDRLETHKNKLLTQVDQTARSAAEKSGDAASAGLTVAEKAAATADATILAAADDGNAQAGKKGKKNQAEHGNKVAGGGGPCGEEGARLCPGKTGAALTKCLVAFRDGISSQACFDSVQAERSRGPASLPPVVKVKGNDDAATAR